MLQKGLIKMRLVGKLREHMLEFEKNIPKNINYKFTGQQEEQAKEMAFLSKYFNY